MSMGYWPTTYWPANYWMADYWPDAPPPSTGLGPLMTMRMQYYGRRPGARDGKSRSRRR